MYPRIKRSNKKYGTYKYLTISQSVHRKGKKPLTKDIANLGNIDNFTTEDIESIIDGLIKIFQLESYSKSDDVEILETLEYGNIVLWQKIWDELGLSEIIRKYVNRNNKRITMEIEKYIQIMVINRCINPISKLALTRWVLGTCYKEMKGYSHLKHDTNYYYRSMDQLTKIKEEVELAIYERLKNLYSINVKLTFYDITSTYFQTDSCPISGFGYSRDHRPDKEQIIIGVVTSYEGFPIKHYVFTGDTTDKMTVGEVVKELKNKYNITETIFVGDRGMITKLNLEKIEGKGFDYIMGVKIHQSEIVEMIMSEDTELSEYEKYMDLKIREKRVKIKDFLVWKVKKIIKENKIEITDKGFSVIEEEIRKLANEDELKYKDFKIIIDSVIENISGKIRYKIFKLIEKYTGEYKNELRYVICLNENNEVIIRNRRHKYISRLSKELDKLFFGNIGKKTAKEIDEVINKIFQGHKKRYKKFFNLKIDKETEKTIGYDKNEQAIKYAEKYDGIFILTTNRNDLGIGEVVESYKNLKEVESLFDDLKNFVDIRPIRHWLEERVRSHVFICILSLLLKRIFEIKYIRGKSITETLEEISKVKLVKYKVKFSEREKRSKVFPKITNINPKQQKYFDMVGLKRPMSLEKFI